MQSQKRGREGGSPVRGPHALERVRPPHHIDNRLDPSVSGLHHTTMSDCIRGQKGCIDAYCFHSQGCGVSKLAQEQKVAKPLIEGGKCKPQSRSAQKSNLGAAGIVSHGASKSKSKSCHRQRTGGPLGWQARRTRWPSEEDPTEKESSEALTSAPRRVDEVLFVVVHFR